MFDFAGLFSCDEATSQGGFPSTGEARPIQFLVRKDGVDFAILNATPALAARTVAGFSKAAPDAIWSYARL